MVLTFFFSPPPRCGFSLCYANLFITNDTIFTLYRSQRLTIWESKHLRLAARSTNYIDAFNPQGLKSYFIDASQLALEVSYVDERTHWPGVSFTLFFFSKKKKGHFYQGKRTHCF